MGAKESKNADASASGSSERVLLSVYEPEQAQMSVPGFGIYHSGVVVYGTEYTFAGTQTSSTGVYTHRPKKQPSSGGQGGWKFKETVDLGACGYSKPEVKEMLAFLSSQFKGNTYHLTSRNCNHFAEALCQQLGVPFPAWVNRAAKVGDSLRGLVGDPSKNKQNQKGGAGVAMGDAPAQTLATVELLSRDCFDHAHMGCLNEAPSRPLRAILPRKPGSKGSVACFLESDCDEQLLLMLPFHRNVKIQTLTIAVRADDEGSRHCPRALKIWKNQRNMDFNSAEEMKAAAEITLSPDQGTADAKSGLLEYTCPLNFAHFKDVNFITIFIESNFGGDEITRVHSLGLLGHDAAGTDMKKLKKVG